MKVLILQGGNSSEREVSLRSAENVAKAVRALGYQVTTYDTKEGNEKLLPLLADIDVVFPVLHGAGGEDGTIQKALEDAQVRFVGTGSEASRLCFDKILSKQALEAAGLPTPRWQEVDKDSYAAAELARSPHVLKPRSSGSSVDTFIIRNPAEPKVDLSVFDRYQTMLIEELITGTELTVGVLGEEALPVVEIIPPENGEFDYENKYNGTTQELCPPKNIDQATQEKAKDLALNTHQSLGAQDFSRTDIMLSEAGELYILEINTIPGLTSQSLFPKAAAEAGASMHDMVDKLLHFAVNKN